MPRPSTLIVVPDVRRVDSDAVREVMAVMKGQLNAAKLRVPPVPDISALASLWQVYAARARKALAAFGIDEAV